MMDKSHGYESIAPIFISGRGQAADGIGVSSVRRWVRQLAPGATVLDLGCGTGKPVTKALIDKGINAYGIDASPTMVKNFQLNFPDRPIACETAEESSFFNLEFQGIIAWGLLFLLPVEAQELIIQKSARALKVGGRFLFTAPAKKIEWNDAMTEQHSISAGAEKYKELLEASGLSLVEEFEDEGENHYYHSVKF